MADGNVTVVIFMKDVAQKLAFVRAYRKLWPPNM